MTTTPAHNNHQVHHDTNSSSPWQQLQLTMTTTPAHHDNNSSSQWQPPQLTMATTPAHHDNHPSSPQPSQLTMTTTPDSPWQRALKCSHYTWHTQRQSFSQIYYAPVTAEHWGVGDIRSCECPQRNWTYINGYNSILIILNNLTMKSKTVTIKLYNPQKIMQFNSSLLKWY